MNKHLKFENVKGYATYANAQKKGEEIAAELSWISYRWVVIALPNGRFAPMAIINNNVPGGPGPFLHYNICTAN